MGFPKQPAPPTIPLPPPAAHAPTLGSSATAVAAQLEKQKAAVAEGLGMDNTIKTGPQGLSAPSTTKTTFLG